jgi:hypothetical protein
MAIGTHIISCITSSSKASPSNCGNYMIGANKEKAPCFVHSDWAVPDLEEKRRGVCEVASRRALVDAVRNLVQLLLNMRH